MTQPSDPQEPAVAPVWANGRPLTRRKFVYYLGASGAGLTLSGILAACTSKSPGTSPSGGQQGTGEAIEGNLPGPPPASGGTYGGRVVVGFADEPSAFGDPALGYSLLDYDVVSGLVFYQSLLAYQGQNGGPTPNIAAAMPDVSADRKTLTFKLRKGVKFHNGREIVAEDFKYSLERMLSPDLEGSWAKSYLSTIVGWADVKSGTTKLLEGVQAPNSDTLVIDLVQADATILNALSSTYTAPVPREEVERLGAGFGKAPVGFGPFKLESYDENGKTAIFSRFDDFFWTGLPYIDEVEMHWGIDPSLQLLQLKNGDLDILGDGIPSDQARQFEADPTTKPLTQEVPVLYPSWMDLNQQRVSAFKDQRVRQALNWAIDRESIAKVLGGTIPFGSPFPENLADFPRTFTPYTYDKTNAMQLLSDAGVTGLTFTFTHVAGNARMAQIVQQQFGDIGVMMQLNQVSSNALFDAQAKGDFDAIDSSWFLLSPSASDLLQGVYGTGAYANYSHYSNPQVDAIIKKGRAIYDAAAADALYAQAEQIIGAEAPGVYLFSNLYVTGRGTRVANYHYRGEYSTYYDRLWISS